jgi:hypothetical protein
MAQTTHPRPNFRRMLNAMALGYPYFLMLVHPTLEKPTRNQIRAYSDRKHKHIYQVQT